jgi:DNA-directed RNA polymerase subunit RPC12/RpoP
MAEPSIPLSKKHGVNPHLTYCPRCKGDANELVLTGAHHKYRCDSCKQVHLGRPKTGRCENVNCHANTSGFHTLVDLGELEPSERLRASQPCDKCQEELKTFQAAIDEGGIPIRCKDCGMEGVIKGHHPLAKAVREQHGGKVMGLEYNKTDCPRCGPKEA